MLYRLASPELRPFLRAREPPRYAPGAPNRRTARAVGRQLRRARLVAGATQEALGLALGVSADTIRRYESGKRRMPPRRLAAAVAFLGFPLSWFFREDDTPDGGEPR
jgi:DNA-binding XRE family transcriptional regulator